MTICTAESVIINKDCTHFRKSYHLVPYMVTLSLYQPSSYSSKTRAVNITPNSTANKTYVQGLGGIRRRSKVLPSERLLGGVEYTGLGDVIENMVLTVVDAEDTI